jgi:hypothetical protein
MRRLRTGLFLPALLVMSLLMGVQAGAVNSPVPPMPVGAPKGPYTNSQSCVHISVSPTVVQVEGTITYTITAGPAAGTPACQGWEKQHGVNTGYYIPNGMGPHCNESQTMCSFEAYDALNGNWAQICAWGPNVETDGGARSCADFYVVGGSTFEVSGRVTNGGPSGEQSGAGQGVGGITIKAVCNADSSLVVYATTDASGDYSMQLPLGNCNLSVAPPAVGAPLSLNVGAQDARTKFSNIDFVVHSSCSNLVSAQLEQPALAAPQVASSPCPLDVTVNALEPLRSGLAFHSQPYTQFPVDFITERNGRRVCESGCTDLVVTVTNPTNGKPVEGAFVSASIGPLHFLSSRSISLTTVGSGDLCETDAHGLIDVGCGQYLLGNKIDLETDAGGHVYLRYWAPGVNVPERTALSVLARLSCSASVCPSHERTGSKRVNLTVSPNLVYSHAAALSEEQVNELIAWANGGNFFSKFLKTTVTAVDSLKYAVKWLQAQELASERVVELLEKVEKVEPLLYVIDAVNVLSELGERQGMIAEFLFVNDLSAVGLGANPFEKSASSLPTFTFSKDLVNLGVAAPFHVGVAGAWWDLATELKELQADPLPLLRRRGTLDMAAFSVKLGVYEVSTCDPSKGACQPGYGVEPGTDLVLRAGIQPELYLKESLMYKGVSYIYFDFTVPYDAIAWAESQPNLQGVVKGGR